MAISIFLSASKMKAISSMQKRFNYIVILFHPSSTISQWFSRAIGISGLPLCYNIHLIKELLANILITLKDDEQSFLLTWS